jgi:hypothetical protein
VSRLTRVAAGPPMTYLLAIALAFGEASAAGPSASQAVDWSGAWTSRGGRDVEIRRNVHGTPRGWDTFAEMLARSRGYSIVVTQTATEVVVTFPRGASNMLTIPGFAFGTEPRATVVNRGEWWTKHMTLARWVDTSLELTSTTFSGWWKNAEPERAQPRATDYRIRLTLTPGVNRDQLLLRVMLSDEKGELEYVQAFYRQP